MWQCLCALEVIWEWSLTIHLCCTSLWWNNFKKILWLFLFPAAKNKVVQLSVVRCQLLQIKAKSGSKNKKSHTKRSSIQDCYRRTEVWSLQDLTLVDGRDPDVVINWIQLPILNGFIALLILYFHCYYSSIKWACSSPTSNYKCTNETTCYDWPL